MAFSKIFTLAVSAFALAAASRLQRNSDLSVKRSQGIIPGAENSTSYTWNSTGTSAQCPSLTPADLQTSLSEFDSLFPPELVYPDPFTRKLQLNDQ